MVRILVLVKALSYGKVTSQILKVQNTHIKEFML